MTHSLATVNHSPYTVSRSRYTGGGSADTVSHSRYTVDDSAGTVQDSRFTVSLSACTVRRSLEGFTSMANADWYPIKLADRIPFHANLSVQATATGITHGLIAAEVTQIATDSTIVAGSINYTEQVVAFAQAVTEWRNLLLSGPNGTALPPVPTPPAAFVYPAGPAIVLASIEFRTRQYRAKIVASSGYTAEIGELYGIIGAEQVVPVTPGLQAFALTASQVRLVIAKGGYDILAVDSKRGGGGWEQIGVSQTAEYIDARAPLVAGQPEQREYRCQGMQNNARVGATSAIVSAVTVP